MSMEAFCGHDNHSFIQSAPKPNAAFSPPQSCFWLNLTKIGQLVFKIFLFESVDDNKIFLFESVDNNDGWWSLAIL